jgi:molecular chaperone GrpE
MTENGDTKAKEPGSAEAPWSPNGDSDADSAERELVALKRKADEHWESYLRMAAELENIRRRAARDVEQARKYGIERLAERLLPVHDSLEAGVSAGAADAQALLEGTRATLRLLQDALQTVGIREIDPHGEPFDPARQEAIAMRPAAEVEPGTVVEVIQKGFEIQDRLLRPARVIVAQEPAGPAA